MATIRQIEANRRNAQKSTGPRTEQGKAIARMNALKSGIDAQSATIFDEDIDALQELTQAYYDQFQPADFRQRFWLDAMIQSEWLRRRLSTVEAEFWMHEVEWRLERYDDDKHSLGAVYAGYSQQSCRLQRRIDSVERNYLRAQHQLDRLQSEQPPSPSQSPSGARAPHPSLNRQLQHFDRKPPTPRPVPSQLGSFRIFLSRHQLPTAATRPASHGVN